MPWVRAVTGVAPTCVEPCDGAADDHHLGGPQLPAEAHEAPGQEDEQRATAEGASPRGAQAVGQPLQPYPGPRGHPCHATPLPAVVCHQQPHQQGAPQPAQGEGGDGQGVEEGEGAGGQPVPVALGPGGVVEILYVLWGGGRHGHRMW